MVAASVTRLPFTNSDLISSSSSIALIIGPPPCTTTGLTPTCRIRTTSRAKFIHRLVAAHGVAAQLDHDRRIRIALQIGQRLESVRAVAIQSRFISCFFILDLNVPVRYPKSGTRAQPPVR